LLKPASGFAAFTSFLPDVSTVTVFCLLTSNFKNSFALTIVLEVVLWWTVLGAKRQEFEEIIVAHVIFSRFMGQIRFFLEKLRKFRKKLVTNWPQVQI